MPTFRKPCYLLDNKEPVCFVHLGRFGDIMILLPACLHIYQTTGVKPVVAVAGEFASILEGVSYVTPWVIEGANWVTHSRPVYDEACKHYSDVRVPKWWDCAGMEPPPPINDEPFTELYHLGRRIIVRPEEWESYMFSQWKACGFNKSEMMQWPLVFDRRSAEREKQLCAYAMGPRRPAILYNMSGATSPVISAAEVINQLRPFQRFGVHLVDLANVKAHRVYDLLGLYDQALCLVTGDTATLHLASAHNIPTIALVNNGGAGSIVKCNAILKLRYAEISTRLYEIGHSVSQLIPKPADAIYGHQLHYNGTR